MKKFFLVIISALLIGFTVSCAAAKTDNTNSTASASGFTPGKYKGTTPAGIIVITFNTNHTFTLTETIPGSTDPMSDTGNWKYDTDRKKVILTYQNIADRVTTFSVINSATIQMNSGSAWTPSTSGSDYNLTLQ
ncbi:copper resistance protein NlpE N-terminal domain-containing protein [Chryseobacterium sp. NRRL B-14859]|uniref:copper resistance protein NlpE N-terminal domain-containing protein n=1 Tax=unclassified Chryseobacterium TaxID=2593645 RepID=UPI003340B8B1